MHVLCTNSGLSRVWHTSSLFFRIFAGSRGDVADDEQQDADADEADDAGDAAGVRQLDEEEFDDDDADEGRAREPQAAAALIVAAQHQGDGAYAPYQRQGRLHAEGSKQGARFPRHAEVVVPDAQDVEADDEP